MAPLRLRTFGGLSVEDTHGGSLLRTGRRPLALLALLAAAGPHGVSRDKVMAMLWPERDTEHSRNSLSQALSILRRELGTEELILGGSEIRLNTDLVRSDIADFESSLAEGQAERAAATYAGPFLDGFFVNDAPEFERWAETHRSLLHTKQRDILERLATEANRRDDRESAVAWYRRLAAHEPTSARAAIGLMEALAASRDGAAALVHFRTYKAALQHELGAEPDAAVSALADRLRNGDWQRSTPATSEQSSQDTTPAAASNEPRVPGDLAVQRLAAPVRHHSRLTLIGIGFIGTLMFVATSYGIANRTSAAAKDAPTLALIPRLPPGADTTERYFSEGVTDELFIALAREPQIRVLGRESAREFSNDSTDLRAAARRLGVAYVLELRPRMRRDTVRISADLVRGPDGTVAWSATFERDLSDLGSLEHEIAQQIFTALEVKLAADQPSGRRHTPTAEAYDLYFRGRFHLTRGTEQDLHRALEYFASAIEQDSLFAAPYAAAATAWNQLADAYLPPLDAYPRSDSLARRALELDESNSEAHTNIGYAAAVLRWDWEVARRELLRALELNPSDAWAHNGYSFYLQARGDLPGGIAELRTATRLEPFSGYYANVLSLTLAYSGQTDSALAEHRRLQEAVPGYRYGGTPGAYALYRQRRCQDVLPGERDSENRLGRPSDMYIICLAAVGRVTEADSLLRRMEVAFKTKYFFPEAIGLAALALGQHDRALDWFELGVSLHSASAPTAWLDPDMRPLLKHPRYRRMLARMYLDDVAK